MDTKQEELFTKQLQKIAKDIGIGEVLRLLSRICINAAYRKNASLKGKIINRLSSTLLDACAKNIAILIKDIMFTVK